MATTPSNVTRTDDVSGDLFLTFDIPGGDKAQGMVLVDQNGQHSGISGTPIYVNVENTTLDVNIDSTSGNLPVDIVANTLGPLDVNIDSQTSALSIDDSTPINVDLASQSGGNITVDIAAQTLAGLSIDDSTPIRIDIDTITTPVPIDDSTPVEVNIAALTSPNPLPVTFSAGTVNKTSTGGTAVASEVIVGAGATLKELRVLLDPSVAAVRYLMLFDAVALPGPGSLPVWRGLVPPAGEMSESWPDGLVFSTGIVAAISSSIDTLTIVGSGEAFFQTIYIT